MPPLFQGPDGLPRCGWCAASERYMAYHDHDWGYPVDDDRRLFEKLCLEGFQSGLSWRTILEKREHIRTAFDGFDIARVAAYTEADVQRLLGDAGIVRHRGKIEAAIHNARMALVLIEEAGSLAAFVWRYEPDAAERVPGPPPAYTPSAMALSRELKRRGWKFVGPTTVYAFMQAMGMVNDHHPGCAFHARVQAARQRFQPPGR